MKKKTTFDNSMPWTEDRLVCARFRNFIVKFIACNSFSTSPRRHM